MSLPSSRYASGIAADDVEIEIANRLDQRVEFQVPAHAPRRVEILADAFAQVARLADVNDRAKPVFHQIDARLVRQGADFLADGFSRRHGGISTQRRKGAKGKFFLRMN